MKKIILGVALLTSAFTSMFMAQSKLLAKTTWKIENIAADGNIVLKKTKHINLLAEEPKFNYLQFTDSKKYKTGNSCFQTDASYSLYEESNQLELYSGISGSSSDCTEPKNIEGTYAYKITGDRMDLQRIQSENMNNEDSQAAEGAETADPGEAIDAASEAAVAAAEAAAKEGNNAKRKKTTKKARK
ncbi:hypothetical protein HZQ19_11505 [Elizabethkingia anophelis]|uniref:hypothetical protein n=1 Tax=Elizabethkingia anophelis TaxID=1117645 RepID=UPI0004E45569|nr:hypothetical protein [Elizabethkingia anophelis]KFC33578.1 hypothetical protein FF18_08350 [Elizabethkingia anophelis]MCT3759294.1 hypothetical protein [Elizabethkingia anophelis]MCT3974067.1 hypothetical protein [Elizabethkingia anophelis]MCT4002380.1 hypothetical protein [Elizabethkingia anophelis]MCT4016513.1 hypothetical protein [Elizabethkingia anophelis]